MSGLPSGCSTGNVGNLGNIGNISFVNFVTDSFFSTAVGTAHVQAYVTTKVSLLINGE
jgi:hypothetical protein